MTAGITEAIASIKGLSAYSLASMADTHCPDNLESAGASFLTGVRDGVAEDLEYYSGGDYSEFEELSELVDAIRELDAFHETADGAPSIYTYTRFQEFADLCAWQEDLDDVTGGGENMEQLAGLALYVIAERLVNALLDYVADFEPEEVDADNL